MSKRAVGRKPWCYWCGSGISVGRMSDPGWFCDRCGAMWDKDGKPKNKQARGGDDA